MKYQVFGGIRLKDYPGRWWVSRQRMGVSLDKFDSLLMQLKMATIGNLMHLMSCLEQLV